jgi:transcriptional regulator with XRE-family HTH domain
MTNKPFPVALAELLDERDWSARHLSRQMREAGKGLAHPTIAMLLRGDLEPSLNAMTLIAKALRIRPEHFAEYRLERARDRLNWRKVGVPAALRELARYS